MKPNQHNNYGERLREIMKNSEDKQEDLFTAWKDQEISESRRRALEEEYKQTKLKLKQARKELRSEYLDADQFEGKIKTFLEALRTKLLILLVGLKNVVLKYTKIAPVWAKVSVVIILLIGGVFFVKSSSTPTGTLGVSSGGNSSAVDNDSSLPELPRENAPFSLLYRQGIDPDLYDVARVSPDGSAQAYTYLDRLSNDGTVFRVTQQKVPDNFNLATAAEDFQATNVIQVDDNIIYHGYSEKGRTQSILFVKNDLLVLVRSPEKLPDDDWASYFLSLQ